MLEIKGKSWEEIGLSNDFLFGKVMRNPKLCKELLERILPELKIEYMEYPELQKPIKEDVDARSVRLDVYVRDGEGTAYNMRCRQWIPKNCRKGADIIRG